MARTTGIISVDPQGRSVVVDITGPAGAGTFYTTDSGATAHTLPLTITDITEFHVTTPADYAVSAKIGDYECLPGGRGISNVGRGCRSAYVVGMSGSDAGEEAGGSAASGPSQGTTIGVATVVDAATVAITYTSPWGIDADGPYYDPDGAAPGEAAILTVDPTTGDWLVVKPEGAVAV